MKSLEITAIQYGPSVTRKIVVKSAAQTDETSVLIVSTHAKFIAHLVKAIHIKSLSSLLFDADDDVADVWHVGALSPIGV